jgi:Domain of unknown function (DUF4105)
MMRFLRGLILALVSLLAVGCVVWAAGALYFDLPWAGLRGAAAIGYLVLVAGVVFWIRGGWKRVGVLFVAFAAVTAWWLSLQPSNDRDWLPDVAKTAWAQIDGDVVTIHNVRNFDYRSATDMIPRWETRTVRLSQLTEADLSINFWGSELMAHPIASFQFADGPPIAISIEIRREVGESFSALGGLYRWFELIYIVGDERDLIRVRTNFRQGEDVYLYRLTLPPEEARRRFLEYLAVLNDLHKKPQWYNAIFANCTTAIRSQRARSYRAVWDWRMLLNGRGDQMLFERGAIVTGGLSFAELRKQAHINEAARAANGSPDFSRKIREGRVGFDTP